MNGGRTTRTNNNKPVNISISFTINPKNIVNQQSYGIESHIKNKKGLNQYHTVDKQLINHASKTPQLLYTERAGNQQDYLVHVEERKHKKNRKGNSVDEASMLAICKKGDGDKSINLCREHESIHVRKPSVKLRRQNQSTTKRYHNKTISKESVNENTAFKSYGLENVALLEHKINYRKNLKSMINKMITNELSKRSLATSLPPHHNRPSRKKRTTLKKHPKQGKTENQVCKYWRQQYQDLETMKGNNIIQKLTSIRSMNDSFFKSEQDEEIRPKQRRTMVINTDHSIDCIDEILELQKQAKYQSRGNDIEKYDIIKVKQTKNLIQYHIAMLNQHMENYDEEEEEKMEGTLRDHNKQIVIVQEFQNTQKQQKDNGNGNETRKSSNRESGEHQHQEYCWTNQQEYSGRRRIKEKLKVSEFQPFISSQMTKEQKIINQIQRAKLNQLKMHEVEKWGELLVFIRQSMKEGKTNHDEILQNIYNFLEQSKIDLQKQRTKSPEKNKNELQDFTNKYSQNQLSNTKPKIEVEINHEPQKLFPSVSLPSPKNYEEENEELKLMNLSMIENALKERHDSLLEKRNRQIANLEEKKMSGRISECQFSSQCEKLQKWTKKQTTQIMQARKTIWKGYNEAKGIIEKSLKSKYFQEENAKKKSMMKCLSEDYLLKNYNYKKLLKPQQSQESTQNQLKKPEKQEQSHKEPKQEQIKILRQTKQKFLQSSLPQSQPIQQPQNHKLANDKVSQNQQIRSNAQTQNNKNITISKEEVTTPKIRNGKQMRQFNNLSSQDDINVIRQKLLDMKNKHLHGDLSHEGKKKQIVYQQLNSDVQDGEDEEISESEMKIINQELGKGDKLSPAGAVDQNDRLKDVLPQDKQDIFQFIFLDLSIEIYQEPCHDNQIMDTINNYVALLKRQANKKKGVKTNLTVVKEYLKRFIGYIIRVHKDVLQALDQPVGPSASEILKYMHDNEDDPADCESSTNQLVLPTRVFEMFQKFFLPSVEFEVYYENDEEKEMKRVDFLKNVLHIHNKALFDAMNEHLDLMRPFGVWGTPFPWKSLSIFLRSVTEEQKEQKLRKGSQKVIENCSYVCGLLVDKEESLVENVKYSSDYLQQLKQDRLSRMLAAELVQNEERWLFYDDEETEVLVQISKSLFIMMVRQVVHENMLLFFKNTTF